MSLNSLIRWFKPREMVFFDLLEASAGNLLTAAQRFDRGLRDPDPLSRSELRRAVKELEHQGDGFTHELLDRLSTTFVTPLEREDILELTRALDDVLDDLDAICERLVLYDVGSLRPAFLEGASLVVEGCAHLEVLVKNLRNMTNPAAIHARVREVGALENRADAVYHLALAEIFHEIPDARELIKWKELLDTLEAAVDRIEYAAQVVGSTVMRNA